MRSRQTIYTAAVAIFAVLAGVGSTPLQAGFIVYQVNVNTSSLSGQGGNLDFQFNPGDGRALSASVTITNFLQSGSSLAASNFLTGDASGLLPGTLSLDNGTAYNDIFQGFTYGSSFSFQLTLSGAAVGSPGGTSGSSFALSLYDAAGINPLLTTDPNGSVLTINVNTDGTTSVETFAQSDTDSTPAAGAVTATPEPSSLIIFLSALPAGLMLWRRRAIHKT